MKAKIITAIFLATPLLAFAGAPATFKNVIEFFIAMLSGVFAVMFSLLVVGLLYGIVLYFVHSDNESKKQELRGYLLWTIIGIAVVVSLWAILRVLGNTVGVTVGIPLLRPPSN
jgi:heme/copper-type cytochrome/quinol oxidase subunit 2